jgi:hypothetical protein
VKSYKQNLPKRASSWSSGWKNLPLTSHTAWAGENVSLGQALQGGGIWGNVVRKGSKADLHDVLWAWVPRGSYHHYGSTTAFLINHIRLFSLTNIWYALDLEVQGASCRSWWENSGRPVEDKPVTKHS